MLFRSKSWYNGYILRDHQIYNPWSIVKCLSKFQENRTIEEYSRLKTKILQNYWEESGNIDFIKPLLKLPIVKSKIDQLLKGMPLFFNLKKQISSGDYEILKQVTALGSNYTIDESVADLLFSYLFAAGYLDGMINNKNTKECLIKGTELSSKIIQKVGARI